MSDAKKKVMDLINKKMRATRAYKKKTARQMGPYRIVVEFIKAMEKVVSEATCAIDFHDGLSTQSNIVYGRLSTIDPEVDIEIIWNREELAEKWEDLQVEGVKIYWSDFWKRKNPMKDAVLYIDIAQLLIEGYLEEDNQ
jgi:hypothetical protein